MKKAQVQISKIFRLNKINFWLTPMYLGVAYVNTS